MFFVNFQEKMLRVHLCSVQWFFRDCRVWFEQRWDRLLGGATHPPPLISNTLLLPDDETRFVFVFAFVIVFV